MRATANTGQDPNLDVLRSVAVLAVFVTHALQVMAGCKFGEHFAFGVETYSLGKVGVLLFFVHTSLVLMQSLERSAANLAGWPLIGRFYIARIFRIYPLSICLILLSLVFSIPPSALDLPYRPEGVSWLVANLLLIQNIARVNTVSCPLWSLPFEVQMYLLLPMLFLWVRRPGSSARLGLIFLSGVLLSQIHPLFRYFPCFLAGVIAYKLLARVPPRFPAWLWCPAVAGAFVLYVLAPYSESSWRDILVCLIAAALIPLFHRRHGAIEAAASHIAKYSYGIYLCHTPVLWLVYRQLAIPNWQRPIWVLIATGVVSVACYHAIEHPLIQIGRRLSSKDADRPRETALAAIV